MRSRLLHRLERAKVAFLAGEARVLQQLQTADRLVAPLRTICGDHPSHKHSIFCLPRLQAVPSCILLLSEPRALDPATNAPLTLAVLPGEHNRHEESKARRTKRTKGQGERG